MYSGTKLLHNYSVFAWKIDWNVLQIFLILFNIKTSWRELFNSSFVIALYLFSLPYVFEACLAWSNWRSSCSIKREERWCSGKSATLWWGDPGFDTRLVLFFCVLEQDTRPYFILSIQSNWVPATAGEVCCDRPASHPGEYSGISYGTDVSHGSGNTWQTLPT